VPFYRSKGTVYNVWFIGVPTLYFRTKVTLQGSWEACTLRLKCLKEHNDVLALPRLPRSSTAIDVMQIPNRTPMQVGDPDLEVGGCPGNELHRST
jgi:hypothetical protein